MYYKIKRLSETISKIFEGKSPGHCLRINDLPREDCFRLCEMLNNKKDFNSFIIVPSLANKKSDFEVTIDTAIELRNKKVSLCLIFPPGIDIPASLLNTFEIFDLKKFLKLIESELLNKLSDEILYTTKKVLEQSKSGLLGRDLKNEDVIEFLETINENPDIRTIGKSLWKVGLIPDNGDLFIERLKLNYDCVKAIAKPSKPQSTIRQRLESTKLRKGKFLDDLEEFLSKYNLYPTKIWLRAISENPPFAFENWEFPEIELSDLEEVKLKKPRRGGNGLLVSGCGSLKCESPETAIIAECGENKKINVAWDTVPKEPVNVGGWLVELIPSREDYGDTEIQNDFPQMNVNPNKRTAKLSLDIDLEENHINWVQVRVVALDENGNYIVDSQNKPIETLSERILLQREELIGIEDKPKLLSYPNFALGFISLAMKFSGDKSDWEPIVQGWTTDEDISFYKIQISDTQICRVAVSNIIKELESRIISDPESTGRFYYDVIDLDQFEVDSIHSNSLFDEEFVEKTYWQNFLNKRKDLFNRIKNKFGTQATIETIYEWSEIITKVKNYSQAYTDLLENITKDEELNVSKKKELLYQALSIDSLQLNIKYNTGNQDALLLLPTHPHRLLWLASYATLLDDWKNQLLELDNKSRKTAIDVSLLNQIQASNVPALIPNEIIDKLDEWYLFIKNINFFVGLFLPVKSKDWARISADVIRFLGYDDTYTINEVNGLQLKKVFEDYIEIDENVKARGINIGVVNPGSGELIASTLNKLIFSKNPIDVSDVMIKRINIAAIAEAPLPVTLNPLEKLKQDFYYSDGIAEKSSALYPALSYWLTEKFETPLFPNGNQNISVYINAIKPSIGLYKYQEEDLENINLYGLLNRWMAKTISERGIYKTIFWIPVGKAARFERHPVDGTLTDLIIELNRTSTSVLGFLIDGNYNTNQICCLKCLIGPDEKGFIEYLHIQSDWVITIDRFLGPEIFDSPIDPSLSNFSEKFLVEYSPSFVEGLGERMLVSSSWVEKVSANIINYIDKYFPNLDEQQVGNIVENILKGIKLYSGNLFFDMFRYSDDFKKSLCLAVIVNNLKDQNLLSNKFIIPVNNDLSKNKNLCDFIVVSMMNEKLLFECCSVESVPSEDAIDRLIDTHNFLYDLFTTDNNEKIAPILERSDFVTQMKYYLKKAARYNLIKEDNKLTKFFDLFSKLENGKTLPQIKMKIFRIDFNSDSENLILENQDDIEIETHSLRSLNLISNSLQNEDSTLGMMNDKSEENINEETQKISDENLKRNEDINIDEINSLTSKEKSSDYPSSVNLILGNVNEQEVKLTVSTKGSPHIIILGIPGQGKTVTINSILTQLTKQGVGSIVFDFHGQFSSQTNPVNKSCNPKIWDVLNDKLPFNPFEVDITELNQNFDFYIKMQSAEIADIFEYVCELGTIQRYTLYESILSLYKNKFNSNDGLNIKIEDLKRKLKQKEKDNNVKNVLARTSKLLEMEFFTENLKWDILSSTKDGLILNLKSLGEGTVQNAVSAFVLRKIYKEILKWDETDKMKLAIVLDEAHRLSKDITLPLIMQEARKFGVMVVIASQNLNHFHPNVIGNVGTKILFRTNAPASNQTSQLVTMRPGKDPRKIVENLNVGSALVQTPEMRYGEVVKMKYSEEN